MISESGRKEAIETAREMILNALEVIQSAVKDTGLEMTVRDRIVRVIEDIVIYSDPKSDLSKEVFGIDSLLEMLSSGVIAEQSVVTQKVIDAIPEDLMSSANLDAYED